MVPPGPARALAKKEKGQFTDAEEHDHSLRMWVARGGLVGVVLFYVAGLLAVLRSASLMRKDKASDSLHEAIGQKVMSFLDKIIDGVMSK